MSERERGRMCMDLQPGDRLRFGKTDVEVELVHKSGRSARLRVVAPLDVDIVKQRAQPGEAAVGNPPFRR